jgi:hypothetical protein
MGLEVVLGIGAMRLREHLPFERIHAMVRGRGVAISLSGVQDQFKAYLSLVGCHAGRTDPSLLKTLKKRGYILPVIDGIQYGPGEPTLYVIVDALSRRPLFAQEMICRGADDLTPFVAQLKELGIRILAVVSDKEKGLVPAIKAALGDVRLQFCQLHYVKNVAKPMQEDLAQLNTEVRRTEEALRALERELTRKKEGADKGEMALPEDVELALEYCQAARAEARCHGRAPFAPSPLKRHEGLERVARSVARTRRKKGGLGATSTSCTHC